MASPDKAGFLRPDLLWTFRQFPLPLLAAGLATAGMLLQIFDGDLSRRLVFGHFNDVILALLTACLAAVAGGFAAWRAQRWMCWAAQGAGFIFGVSLVFWSGGFQPGGTFPLLPVVMVCAISVSAGLAVQGGRAGFWFANARLAANLALTLVALAITITGGALILSALEGLLGLESDSVAETLSILTVCFAFPLLWLALARLDPVPLTEDNLLLRVVSVATDALLIPLVLTFGAVIHVYALRIAIVGELPNGQIGWIVPVYLLVGYVIYLLASGPAPRLPKVREFFRRAWIPSTLAPLVLLGLALTVRLRAYGVTDERYFLLLVIIGGALLAASALVRRPFDIRLLPLIAGVLMLTAAIGPFSVLNVAVRSQTERARAILASVPPERWTTKEDGGLTDTQRRDLLSALEYLGRRQALDVQTLADVWPPQVPKFSWALEERLERPKRTATADFTFNEGEVFQVGSLIWMDDVNVYWNPWARRNDVRGGSLHHDLRFEGRHVLIVEGEGRTTRFDLSPLLSMDASIPTAKRPTLSSIEGRRGDVIVKRFKRLIGPDGTKFDDMRISIVLY